MNYIYKLFIIKQDLFSNAKKKELIGEFVKCPDDFLFSYNLFFLQYVKKWQISAMNSMVASITLHNSQFTLVPKSLLYLISTLIDRFSPTDNNFT